MKTPNVWQGLVRIVGTVEGLTIYLSGFRYPKIQVMPNIQHQSNMFRSTRSTRRIQVCESNDRVEY
jgi:hypothetical protein